MHTEGDVLELGSGLHSTFLLHWMCLVHDRQLVTYENNRKFYDMVKHCETDHRADHHKVIFVDDWDAIEIAKEWGVALVDHSPSIRRKEEMKRLADYAQAVVVHDTQGRSKKHYHYRDAFPFYKYKKGYPKLMPQTLILSNFRDVSKW